MLVRLDFLHPSAATSSASSTRDSLIVDQLTNCGVVESKKRASILSYTSILDKRREARAAHQGGAHAAPCTPVRQNDYRLSIIAGVRGLESFPSPASSHRRRRI